MNGMPALKLSLALTRRVGLWQSPEPSFFAFPLPSYKDLEVKLRRVHGEPITVSEYTLSYWR